MIGTIVSLVVKNVVQFLKPKNEREFGVSMNGGKLGITKFTITSNEEKEYYTETDLKRIFERKGVDNPLTMSDFELFETTVRGEKIYRKKQVNMATSVANKSILSSVSKNSNNILSANSGVLTLESPKEPKQPQKTLLIVLGVSMSVIIIYNILKA